MNTITLAEKLGTTPHISALLRKAARLGLDAEGLKRLAVQRGCTYYRNGGASPFAPVSEAQFSNEELAITLLNVALSYDPQAIRVGAAMLGAEGNDIGKISRLAMLERSEAVVRYVAEAGRRYEPENSFWRELLSRLPATRPPESSVVPHPTRFVAMTGITRRGVETIIEWVRPVKTVV